MPHSALLAKLASFGIQGQLLGWIRGFLRDRFQFTSYPDAVQGTRKRHWAATVNMMIMTPQLRTSQIYLHTDHAKLVFRASSPQDCALEHADLDAIEL